MNAKEKRLLYEKYGRARSSLAKVEMEAAAKMNTAGQKIKKSPGKKTREIN